MKKIPALSFLVVFLLFAVEVGAVNTSMPRISVDLLNENPHYDDTQNSIPVYDPLEPLNRVFFTFNDKLYFWVEKPIITGYSNVVSQDIRQAISNFFNNLASPISLVNNLLQGRFADAGTVTARFFINTTLGVYGFGDAASTAFNMKAKPADFGQTLGVWGLGEGFYICWPVLGPNNVRDSVGFAGDIMANPVTYVDMNTTQQISLYAGQKINYMSLSPDVYDELVRYSLDPYVAARQAYHEYRQDKIEKHASGKEVRD